jgi:hypothetical protein
MAALGQDKHKTKDSNRYSLVLKSLQP